MALSYHKWKEDALDNREGACLGQQRMNQHDCAVLLSLLWGRQTVMNEWKTTNHKPGLGLWRDVGALQLALQRLERFSSSCHPRQWCRTHALAHIHRNVHPPLSVLGLGGLGSRVQSGVTDSVGSTPYIPQSRMSASIKISTTLLCVQLVSKNPCVPQWVKGCWWCLVAFPWWWSTQHHKGILHKYRGHQCLTFLFDWQEMVFLDLMVKLQLIFASSILLEFNSDA